MIPGNELTTGAEGDALQADDVPEPSSKTPDENRRKVVAYLLSTLDGVVGGPANWSFDSFDEEMSEQLRQVIAPQDAVLLGRITYDEWRQTWPSSKREPFASFINATRKYVVSRTMERADWNNSTVMHDVSDGLPALKAVPGGEIGIHGSVSLVRSLLQRSLIDELKIVVMPVLVGAGARLFDDESHLQRLTLLNCKRTDKGVMLNTYRVSPSSADAAPNNAIPAREI